MKKFFKLAVIALTAAIFVSCEYKSVETPLNDKLTRFTAKNYDGTIVYGIRDSSGQEVIPARFKSVLLYAGGILTKNNEGLRFYTTDGRLIYKAPEADIFEENGDLIFQTYYERYRLVSADNGNAENPAKGINFHGRYYAFSQDEYGLGCAVCNKDGKQLLYGGRIICLFSQAEDKYYFIALNERTATAYDENGNELFPIDVEKLRLPSPEWSDISVEKVITPNKLEAYKASNRK